MAGRRAHVDATKFDEFIQSIPEEGRGQGYWRIKRDTQPANGHGTMCVYAGFLEVKDQESYDELRDRVKREIAVFKGPGPFYAIPCDSNRKELKNLDQVKFEFKEAEVPLPEPTNVPQMDPVGDTMKMVKKMANDSAQLQQIELQKRLMDKYLGVDDKKKEEESEVKETPSNMSDMLMMMQLMNPKDAKAPSTDHGIQQILDAKLQATMAEMKSMVQGLQVQIQSQPKDDTKFEKLLETLVATNQASQGKSGTDQMIMMMRQQAEERDKQREVEDRRREEQRQAEERRREEERKRYEDERRAEERKMEEERKRYDLERKAQEDRRAEEHKAEERRREEDRKAEERRREEERKEERKRYEDQVRGERERAAIDVGEQRRRYDEELKLRREEAKQDQERYRSSATDQQKQQLQMFELIRDNKNSGLELTAKVVDSMTSAGMTSMKTAQEAAEAIMSVAKRSSAVKEDGGGFGQVIKDAVSAAAPLLQPYADADAKMKMMQEAAAQRQFERRPQREVQAPRAPAPQVRTEAQPSQNSGMSGTSQRPIQQQVPQGAVNSNGNGEIVNTKEDEMGGIVARYLQAYPIVREAMVDNLKDGIGPEAFVSIVEGLNQPTLEGLLASLRPERTMQYVKEAMDDNEKKLVDANTEWFKQLRAEMIELVKSQTEEEAEPAQQEPAEEPVIEEPAPKAVVPKARK